MEESTESTAAMPESRYQLPQNTFGSSMNLLLAAAWRGVAPWDDVAASTALGAEKGQQAYVGSQAVAPPARPAPFLSESLPLPFAGRLGGGGESSRAPGRRCVLSESTSFK